MTTSGTVTRELNANQTQDLQIIKQLYRASSLDCTNRPNATAEIVLADFLITELRLTEDATVSVMTDFDAKNMTLSYTCANYWSITIDKTGLLFTTFSDLISNDLFSQTSIMAFYLAVSYTVGTTFRSTFMYKGDRVFIVDSPNTDAMLNLMDCIHMMRLEKNIKK